MRITLLFTLTLVAFAQMPRLYPSPAPSAPPGYEYVEYVDETGQRVGLPVKKPATKVIVASSSQATTPLTSITCSGATPCNTTTMASSTNGTVPATIGSGTMEFRAVDVGNYFEVLLKPGSGYAIDKIRVYLDGVEVELTEQEFYQAVKDWKQKAGKN